MTAIDPEVLSLVSLSRRPAVLETDRVEQALATLIITADLRPGERTTQAWLVQQLGCSRHALREAIQRLMSTGLFSYQPNQGISVAPLDVEKFAAALEMLDVLFPMSARLAALRIRDEQLRKLDLLVAKALELDGGHDYAPVALLESEFHRALAEGAENDYLTDSVTHAGLGTLRSGHLAYRRDGTVRPFWEAHARVVAAVRRRDPDAAEREMIEHQRLVKERFLGLRTQIG